MTARGIPRPAPWSDAEVQRARDLRTMGLPDAEIARALGRARSGVERKIGRAAANPVTAPIKGTGPRRTAKGNVGVLPLPSGYPDTWGLISSDPWPEQLYRRNAGSNV